MLNCLVKAIEAEEGFGVAPFYYEELAKIFRKRKDYCKEVAILERYSNQNHGYGVANPKMIERLGKARKLANQCK